MARKRISPRQKRLELICAIAGMVIGIIAGFPFGYWFLPNVGFVTAVTGKLDPLGTGSMIAWLLAMAGIWIGKSMAGDWYRRVRLNEQREDRRKRYADVIADHEAYTASQAEKEQEAAKKAAPAEKKTPK